MMMMEKKGEGGEGKQIRIGSVFFLSFFSLLHYVEPWFWSVFVMRHHYIGCCTYTFRSVLILFYFALVHFVEVSCFFLNPHPPPP